MLWIKPALVPWPSTHEDVVGSFCDLQICSSDKPGRCAAALRTALGFALLLLDSPPALV